MAQLGGSARPPPRSQARGSPFPHCNSRAKGFETFARFEQVSLALRIPRTQRDPRASSTLTSVPTPATRATGAYFLHTANTLIRGLSAVASRAPRAPHAQPALLEVAEAVSQRGVLSGRFSTDSGMPQNFIESRGEQGFLLPPDVRDWVPPDHLAWFVIDAVKEMELGAFYAAYRADGHGRAAYDPAMVVTLILFAFATGVQSSRAIERHCREHVASG